MDERVQPGDGLRHRPGGGGHCLLLRLDEGEPKLNVWANIGLIAGAYLLGSLPIVYWIGRLYGIDLTKEEDAHIALWHKVGRLPGALGISSDIIKGIAIVVVGKALHFDIEIVALSGMMAVAGQMWPVFTSFNGGKGNTTGIAMIVFLVAFKPLVIALVPIAAGMLVRTAPRLLNRKQSMEERLKLGGPPSLSMPLGMAVGFAVLPLSTWAFRQPTGETLALLGLFLLIMLRRLTAQLRPDLEEARAKSVSTGSVLVNRLLFDRSFR